MKVWRVQNSRGQGPYDSGSEVRSRTISYRHPGPREDFSVFRLVEDEDYIDNQKAFWDLIKPYKFGFPTETALHQWFDMEDMQILKDEGFSVVELDVSNVIVSDSGKQCIFCC